MNSAQKVVENLIATHGTLPGPYRVVVIEDSALAKVLGRLLDLLGHHVEIACDGRSGIDLVKSTEPDAVFTRIELPDMDGYCVAREIRRSCLKQPVVIAHTAYGKWQIGERARQAGFDLIVNKPVSLSYLFEALSVVAGTSDCEEFRL